MASSKGLLCIRRTGGFTIIELVMVLVLMVIVAVVVSPLIFRGGEAVDVSAVARKIADDIRYARSLAMARYRLTTPDATNPQFRFRIRFNVADANCPGADQYTIVSDQDNNGTWGENPNASGIVESARLPSTGADYFCVRLNSGDFAGVTASADFGGSVPGILEFDYLGVPYDSDGNKLTASKTVTVTKGADSSTITVTPYTGRVTVQ